MLIPIYMSSLFYILTNKNIHLLKNINKTHIIIINLYKFQILRKSIKDKSNKIYYSN